MAWIDTWVASLHPNDPHREFWGNVCFPLDRAFRDCTLRQQIRIGAGAETIRLRISNEYSETTLSISSLTVALPYAPNGASRIGSSWIITDSVKPVCFNGNSEVDVPPGVTWLSDPVTFPLEAGADLTISLYLANGQERSLVAGHEMAKTTSWLCHGDHAVKESLDDPIPFSRWYYITGVERLIGKKEDAATLICLGDSITDQGDRAWDSNQYLGWPNLLARRLWSSKRLSHITVLNCGISGDRLWSGGLRRFDRDVMLRPRAKYLFILMGTNDLGNTPDLVEDQEQLFRRLVTSYLQIIEKCRSQNITVFASTITPFLTVEAQTNKRDSFREGTRLRINDWLKDEAPLDYVVDWASALGDPANPHIMDARYRFNDFVHPNSKACQVMAEAIDLTAFVGE